MSFLYNPIQVLSETFNTKRIIKDVIKSKNQENPYFVCNLDDVIYKYVLWNNVMPRIKPHYAVKCNDHPTLLRILVALGLGFDCASKTEMQTMLSLGVQPDDIIYAHTTKHPSHIKYASCNGISLMTFDGETELHKMKDLSKNTRAIIRIKYDASALCVMGVKFGCDPETEAPDLLKIASNLGIKVVGVSFHVGSGCKDATAFRGAIKAARKIFDVAPQLGHTFKYLDIGGGYPGEADAIYEYAKIINEAIDLYFPEDSVTIISEPGTYFVKTAFTSVCSVHSIRRQSIINGNNNAMVKYMYYLNDGAFCSLNGILSYNIIRTPVTLKEYKNPKKYLSILWGPTCDSADKIIDNIFLPKLKIGDWLIFNDMGDYTLPLCTTFNGFDLPDVYMHISLKNWFMIHSRSPLTENDFLMDVERALSIELEPEEKLPEN